MNEPHSITAPCTRREAVRRVADPLVPLYGEREAHQIALTVVSELARISPAALLADPAAPIAVAGLEPIAAQLSAGRPMQYVLGHTEFCGLEIGVREGALIPRPETEELAAWIAQTNPQARRILDVGTGSGCIALALKYLLPDAEVYGADLSDEALVIARANASALGLEVRFRRADALRETGSSYPSGSPSFVHAGMNRRPAPPASDRATKPEAGSSASQHNDLGNCGETGSRTTACNAGSGFSAAGSATASSMPHPDAGAVIHAVPGTQGCAIHRPSDGAVHPHTQTVVHTDPHSPDSGFFPDDTARCENRIDTPAIGSLPSIETDIRATPAATEAPALAEVFGGGFDAIVSNPPYIPRRERTAMRRNVTEFEPSMALFVPDDDPLLFYRAIARAGRRMLAPGGRLYFEIHELLAAETCDLLAAEGYAEVELRNDFNDKPRTLCARIKI